MVLGHYWVELVSIWWYLVNMGGTGQYLVVLGQYLEVLVSSWW